MDSDLKSVQSSSALEVQPSGNRSESGGVQDKEDKLTTPAVSTSSGLSAAAPEGARLKVEEIEKDLALLTTMDDANKKDFILKLIAARTQSADEKRSARKAAWIAETQEEISKRKQFRENKLLMIIPELVWEQIMDHIQGYEEKTGMLNMSLLWRDLLKNKRTKFLFYKAFVELHEDKDLHLHIGDILRCRAVCQEWKNHIENNFQNSHLENLRLERGFTTVLFRGHSAWEPEVLIMLFDTDIPNLSRFITWTNQTYSPEANPFISRKLSLGYEVAGAGAALCQLYWNEMNCLLQARGGQVWQADIKLEKDLDCIDAYDEIRNCLKLMPNLKGLRIYGRNHLILSDQIPQSKLAKESNERLKIYIREHPLPELSNLRSIITQMIPKLVIQEMMSKYGSTLVTVFYSGEGGNPCSIAEETNNLPHLERFYLTSLHLFLPESKFTWNWSLLREVALVYLNIEATAIPNLFQSLSGLKTSLRKLLLSMDQHDGPPVKLDSCTMKSLSLELPHLEEFCFGVSRINLKTVDFILPMVSLKELSVTYYKRVSKLQKSKMKKDESVAVATSSHPMSEDIIQFWDYTNRLYESNVWELLPELRKVTVAIFKKVEKSQIEIFLGLGEPDLFKQKIYTREGFKQHCTAREM